MVKGLTLFLAKAGDTPDKISGPCTDRLTLVPDFRIFRQLIDLSGQTPLGQETLSAKPSLTVYWLPGPGCVDLLLETGVTARSIDRYGRPLTFIRAREFQRIKIADDVHPHNKAIAAAIGSLPEDTIIILYWF